MITKFIFIGFILLHILSGVFQNIFKGTSYSISLLPSLFFVFLLGILFLKIIRINLKWLVIVFIISFLLILEFIISLLIYGTEGFNKAFFSYYYLIIVFLSSPFVCFFVNKTPTDFIHKTLLATLILLLFIGFLSKYLWDGSNKRMILFIEPSHYALVLLPYVVYFYIWGKI